MVKALTSSPPGCGAMRWRCFEARGSLPTRKIEQRARYSRDCRDARRPHRRDARSVGAAAVHLVWTRPASMFVQRG
jgi:hypothetical protein